MSYPTPDQPVGGSQFPPGQPYGAPAQPGVPAQPGYPTQPGYPQPGYPAQPGYPQPGSPRSRGPLVAWISGGVVVVVAVVLIIVFTVGGSGGSGGCASLSSKASALATKMTQDEAGGDASALAGDLNQFKSILDDAADNESGKTADDLHKLAGDFGSLASVVGNGGGDLSSLADDESALDALNADGDAVDQDCNISDPFSG